MADLDSPDEDDSAHDLPATERAAALGPALAAASPAKADAFLDAQTAIAWLQKEHLHEQRDLQISHLRWRRFNDWMRSGWQTGLVFLCAIAIAAFATALWDASRADGLVVDAFSVPHDFEQRGIGGDVIAGDMTERLASIRRTAVNISYSNTSDVSRNRSDAIKVEIPETGISIGEVWRYMRAWLGHERHVAGSLRELPDGRVTLSASLDGADRFAVTGKPSDMDALEQAVAEDIFGAFDPVNHINYLSISGHSRAAMDAAAQFASVARGLYHADAYALWSYTTAFATGDVHTALARARVGESIDPGLAVPHVMAARMNFFMGHSEEQLAEDRTIMSLQNAQQLPAHQGAGFAEMQAQASGQIARLSGDFANATKWNCSHSCVYAGLLFSDSIVAARLHDVPRAQTLLERSVAAGGGELSDASEARYWLYAARGDWPAALAESRGLRLTYALSHDNIDPRFDAIVKATYVAPLVAVAAAHTGDFAKAHATIDGSPPDCIPCETARANVAALEDNTAVAAQWFARATRDAPSIPFAYADWGAMLLRSGLYDAAIGKFRDANLKGPHFADPLEMWGEALMQKNRSDLALAKFEEANKYAPNWGRLHLEWGKAFFNAGKKDEAKKQFAIAAGLDLSAADRAQVSKMVREAR